MGADELVAIKIINKNAFVAGIGISPSIDDRLKIDWLIGRFFGDDCWRDGVLARDFDSGLRLQSKIKKIDGNGE